MIEPYSGRALYQLENDRGLYEAMGGAGSSFGIATEFLYKIYPRPETQPIIAMIYIEDNYDLRKLEKAAKDGRFHVSWFIAYANRKLGLGVLVSKKSNFCPIWGTLVVKQETKVIPISAAKNTVSNFAVHM